MQGLRPRFIAVKPSAAYGRNGYAQLAFAAYPPSFRFAPLSPAFHDQLHFTLSSAVWFAVPRLRGSRMIVRLWASCAIIGFVAAVLAWLFLA